MSLPTDVLYEIYGHVQDKTTIDSALEVVPDIVHSAVRHIRSPRVVEVPVSYLTAFKRLERTTNILVHTTEEDLDTLRPLSHLRGLCVEVHTDDASSSYCIERLVDIFCVASKRDDQLFVFRVADRDVGWCAIYHNSHCVSVDHTLAPEGFTYDDVSVLYPRPYYDFLRSVRPYVDDRLGRVLDIVLKYGNLGDIEQEEDLLSPIAEQVGDRLEDFKVCMRDFIAEGAGKTAYDQILESLVASRDLPWHLLHHFDIPDRLVLYTKEEASTVVNTLYN